MLYNIYIYNSDWIRHVVYKVKISQACANWIHSKHLLRVLLCRLWRLRLLLHCCDLCLGTLGICWEASDRYRRGFQKSWGMPYCFDKVRTNGLYICMCACISKGPLSSWVARPAFIDAIMLAETWSSMIDWHCHVVHYWRISSKFYRYKGSNLYMHAWV